MCLARLPGGTGKAYSVFRNIFVFLARLPHRLEAIGTRVRASCREAVAVRLAREMFGSAKA